MKAKARRALTWGGMFLLAYAGGSWLGRFATGGLSDAPSAGQTASAEDSWEQQEGVRNAAVAAAMPLQHSAPDEPGNHVCEGCDAGETRGRQLAQYLGLYYGSASLDEEALADAQDDDDAQQERDATLARPSVPAPTLPILPSVGSAAEP